MAKFCSNCGNEMLDNADVCVKCGTLVGNNRTNNNTNTKKGLPTWAIVLIVLGCVILAFAILFGAIFLFSYKVIKNTGIDIKNEIEEYTESKETKTVTGSVGESLTGEDFKITLVKAEKYDSVNDNVPEAGKEYLVFFFEVENITDDSERISTFDFNGYADNHRVFPSYILGNIDEAKLFGDNLGASEKMTGYIAYEVDKNWEEFEVRYDEYDDIKLVFKVTNEIENGV